MELRGWLNGRWHGGFGLWADLRYGIQLKGTTVRRVFDPDVTFAPLSSQIELDWDPGDYQVVELAPWYRVAGSMTLLAGYRYHRKGRDAFSVAATDGTTPPAGDAAPDPEILVPHSESSSSRFMVGMVYNRDMPKLDGSRGRPLEIRVTYRKVVGGGGGNVPKAGSIEAGFRFFAKLWGENDADPFPPPPPVFAPRTGTLPVPALPSRLPALSPAAPGAHAGSSTDCQPR